jgi:secretion/DNA translocation related TadE-like protein
VRGERGSITLVLAGTLPIVLVLTMGTADLGSVLAARSQARAAAEVSALAAAQELALPSGAEPSDLAAVYASANGATLISCACPRGGFEAVVEVRVPVGPSFFVPSATTVAARARAVVDVPSA